MQAKLSHLDKLNKAPAKIKDLYKELRLRILGLDERITEKATIPYIAYSLKKNFAEVHIYTRKSRIGIHLRNINYRGHTQNMETVPETHLWTLNKRVYIDDEQDLNYIMQLIEQSYKDVL